MPVESLRKPSTRRALRFRKASLCALRTTVQSFVPIELRPTADQEGGHGASPSAVFRGSGGGASLRTRGDPAARLSALPEPADSEPGARAQGQSPGPDPAACAADARGRAVPPGVPRHSGRGRSRRGSREGDGAGRDPGLRHRDLSRYRLAPPGRGPAPLRRARSYGQDPLREPLAGGQIGSLRKGGWTSGLSVFPSRRTAWSPKRRAVCGSWSRSRRNTPWLARRH